MIKTQYTVKKDDTTSQIAKNYNVTTQQIIDANPDVFTPDRPQDGSLIFPGDVFNIPTGQLDELKQIQAIKADSEDELTILIDNVKCPIPYDFELIEYFDACSNSFSFSYPFNPKLKNPAYKINIDDFKTKGLPSCKIYIGSEPSINGSIEVPANKITATNTIQTLAGRNGTFLLEKSDIFPSLDREYLNLTLEEFANIVASKYGIGVEVQSGLNISEPFEKIELEDNEKPFASISRLARERSCILSNTGDGKLLIHKTEQSEPVAHFKIDRDFLKFLGVPELEFVFDTRTLYGHYQGKTTTTDDQNLIENVKSKNLVQQSIKITDFSDANNKTLGPMTEYEEQKAVREFYKNVIPFPSWLNPNTGKKWKGGQTITLEVADGNVKTAIMLIRSITFTKNPNNVKVANLNLIPEGVY